MKENRFLRDLQHELMNFNFFVAYRLSRRIHKAEEEGYELSFFEDKLWEDLTNKIQEYEEKLSREDCP